MRASTIVLLSLALLAWVAPGDTASAGCTASLDCGCATIQCTGNTTCTVGANSVTCDGRTTACPQQQSCSTTTQCPDGSTIGCSGTSCNGDCTSEPGCWVACDDDGDGIGVDDFTWCPGFEGCLICPCGLGF